MGKEVDLLLEQNYREYMLAPEVRDEVVGGPGVVGPDVGGAVEVRSHNVHVSQSTVNRIGKLNTNMHDFGIFPNVVGGVVLPFAY